ncbi:hypothetical protein K8I61_19545 [bacterium]|nr:hypothetical protein [bacterium]
MVSFEGNGPDAAGRQALPSRRLKSSFDKLHALEEEMVRRDLDAVRRRGRQRRWGGLALSVVAAAAAFTLYARIGGGRFGAGDDVPVRVALHSAHLRTDGRLRVFLEVEEFGSPPGRRTFENVEGQVHRKDDDTIYRAAVIPVYLGPGRVRLLVQIPDFPAGPEEDLLWIDIVGRSGKSNRVIVRRLDPEP